MASTAVVIAVGVKGDTGERDILGLDVGPSEDGSFWLTFLRSLVARGLKGVRLVTSDAHPTGGLLSLPQYEWPALYTTNFNRLIFSELHSGNVQR